MLDIIVICIENKSSLCYNYTMKTIATISTPFGSGAIGIIRMSGDNALGIASKMFSTKSLESFQYAQPNYMYYGTLTTQNFKDKILAVYFKAPNSYTGEDLVELHCHGGIRLVSEVLEECVRLGAFPADKGEFTKRAFLNGKFALSDCEGIIDMINGESIASLKAGSRLMQGGVASEIDHCQEMLKDSIAELEASLDYPDEMEEESISNSRETLDKVEKELQKLVDTKRVGGYIKQGIVVGIVGQANVGKSSLLNALLGRERAIVTDIAGTTRDSLEECIEHKGIILRLVDTAGIRDTQDVVEALGVERSLDIAKNSDITLFVTPNDRQLNNEEQRLLEELGKQNAKVVMVFNKSDLGNVHTEEGIKISAKHKQGIEELKDKIVQLVVGENVDMSGNIITNTRHAQAILDSLVAIKSAKEMLDIQPTECILLDLRQAYFELGKITGNTASEDIIDSIFSKFCLGK